jgi:hypothetical protein
MSSRMEGGANRNRSNRQKDVSNETDSRSDDDGLVSSPLGTGRGEERGALTSSP